MGARGSRNRYGLMHSFFPLYDFREIKAGPETTIETSLNPAEIQGFQVSAC